MKKNLLFLTLVLFIYGCSTPIQNTTTQDIVKQDTRLNEPNYSIKTESIAKVESEFIDKSQETPSFEEIDDIVAVCHNNSIHCDINCEDWNVTNKSYILPYKNGYIGYDYGGNGEGRGYYLTYKSLDNPCDSAISTTDEIFFWHTRYAHNKAEFGYDEYPDNKLYVNNGLFSGIPMGEVAKVLDCEAGKDMMEDDTCKRQVDKYMYNLIMCNEENEYFTKWMNKFKTDIDNSKFTPISFRVARYEECNDKNKFENLLQKDGKVNSQLTDEERKYYSKLHEEALHKCAMEYLEN